MTVLEVFAAWSSGAADAHSQIAVARATDAITDVFGCMIAGAFEPGPIALRQALPALGANSTSARASVMGQVDYAAAPWAALANATTAQTHDVDDGFLPLRSHPSSVLLPSLFALAQERRLSGRALIDAYIVGLELHYYVGSGVMPALAGVGYHPTSTAGCIGAAGGCARLLGLDPARAAHAMSLAVSMAAGVKGQKGSMAKPLHAGLGAQHAVQAALLAQAGYEGRLDVLEGKFGFSQVYGGRDAPGWETVLPRVGALPPVIESQGLMVKRFPCCGSSHRLLDCLLELQSEHGFSADQVQEITARLPYGFFHSLAYPEPRDVPEAKFSMQYAMAATLLNGALTFSDFTPQAIQRPEVRALFARIKMFPFEDTPEKTHEQLTRAHELELRLKDGRTFRKERNLAKGTLAFPFDEQDRQEKFGACCANSFSPQASSALYKQLSTLSSVPNLDDLAQSLFAPVAAH